MPEECRTREQPEPHGALSVKLSILKSRGERIRLPVSTASSSFEEIRTRAAGPRCGEQSSRPPVTDSSGHLRL